MKTGLNSSIHSKMNGKFFIELTHPDGTVIEIHRCESEKRAITCVIPPNIKMTRIKYEPDGLPEDSTEFSPE